MQTFICEICGDAYIGEAKPHNCPFCGARMSFIKDGNEANPIVNQQVEVSEVSRKNLLETLDLEIKANAIYLCMANQASTYEIKAMYKRLAKIELEHAVIVTKILKIEMPASGEEACSTEDVENFKKTLELEDHAQKLYVDFAKQAIEQPIKIFFTALTQVEGDHGILIEKYLK